MAPSRQRAAVAAAAPATAPAGVATAPAGAGLLPVPDAGYLDARAPGQGGVVADVVHSMFNPGINDNLVRVLYGALLALFVSLVSLGFLWEWNVHVAVLLTANVGLFLSVHWCVRACVRGAQRPCLCMCVRTHDPVCAPGRGEHEVAVSVSVSVCVGGGGGGRGDWRGGAL
jgi:hypothetical protein